MSQIVENKTYLVMLKTPSKHS